MQPSNRTQALPGNFFALVERQIQELQVQGEDIIRLDIGSPDLPPHPDVIAALAASAADPGKHGYQAHLGPLKLRQAWAAQYQNQFGVALHPETEILPLLGSKEGIFHLSMAYLNPGDVALIPDPGYMTYTRGAVFAGAVPQSFMLSPENEFLPDFSSISPAALQKAKLLWLNYPNNPTGATCTLQVFQQAVDFARAHGLLLCHDAAYAQVAFDGFRPPSIFQIPGAKDIAVEFNSLSKSHNMPGWRTGVVVGCAPVIQSLFKLKSNMDSGAFRPVLDASAAALQLPEDWHLQRNAIYQERRDLMYAALQEIGCYALKPRASIYLWAKIPTGMTSLDFCSHTLQYARVSLTPGPVFGSAGEGYVRIALTTATPRLEEAVTRLVKASEQIKPA